MRTCLTLLALLVAPPLHAGPVPIPTGALVVVQLNGRGPAVEHLTQFLEAVQPDAAKDLPQRLRKLLADAAPGRDVDSVTPGERVVGVAFTFDGWNSPTPPWVWLVPVKDAATFRKTLVTDDERGDFEAGKEGVDRAGPWFLVGRPGYVAVSASEAAAKAFHASRELVTPERLAGLAPIVNDSELSAYVNVIAVNAQYGDVVRSTVQFAGLMLRNGGGPLPAFDPRQVETVQFALDGVTQTLADGRDLAVGVNFGTDGVTVRAEVAFTPGSPTAKQFAADKPAAKAFKASREFVTPERLGALAGIVNDSDLSAYINVAAVNAQCGDVVRSTVQFAGLMLRNGGGPIPAFDPRQVETVQLVLDGLAQTLADGRDLAVGLTFGAEGVTLRAEVAFTPGSPTAKQFAADKPAALDELLTLPAGFTAYTASQWGPAASAVVRRLTREYEAPADDERATAAVTAFDATGRDGVRVSVSRDGESGTLLVTPDAAKRTAAHAKLLRTMPAAGYARNVKLADAPGLREKALDAGGFALNRGQLTLDLEAGVATIRDPNVKQATLESMRRLVREKTVLWFGDDGKRHALLEATDEVAATKLLTSLLADTDRVGGNAAFTATRQRLPKSASYLLLAEAGPTVATLSDYTRSVAGALPAVPGFDIPEFRTLKNPPQSFVGVTLTAQGGGVGLTLFVPAAAAKVAADSVVIPAP